MFGVSCFQLEILNSLGQMLGALHWELCFAVVSAWLCPVCFVELTVLELCCVTQQQLSTSFPTGERKSNYNIYIYLTIAPFFIPQIQSTASYRTLQSPNLSQLKAGQEITDLCL